LNDNLRCLTQSPNFPDDFPFLATSALKQTQSFANWAGNEPLLCSKYTITVVEIAPIKCMLGPQINYV